jgi:transposase
MKKKKKKKRGSQPSGRRWTQWKEPEAREALAAWRSSGLSVVAFCAREGYSETRLRYWSERLGKAPPVPVSFVPVTLVDSARTGHIEIERGGVVVRVREDLDVAHVARLVAALAAREPTC